MKQGAGKMRAVVYDTYGTPDVLRMEEVEIPQPLDHEILIRVHAVSVNSWDWDLLRGKPFVNRLGGLRKPRYRTLGADIAGRVVSVGAAVCKFEQGDEVFGDISGCGWGGFAEYVCATEDALTLKPEGLSFEQAAAIPQAAVLALQGLRDKGKLSKGYQILINGAGGGVGTFGIQYAKLLEADVTGVDRGEKLDMLRSIGADHVMDKPNHYDQLVWKSFIESGQVMPILDRRFSLTDTAKALEYFGEGRAVGKVVIHME